MSSKQLEAFMEGMGFDDKEKAKMREGIDAMIGVEMADEEPDDNHPERRQQ